MGAGYTVARVSASFRSRWQQGEGGAGGRQVPGVDRVNDLHIWGLKPGVALLSAHLVIAGGADSCAALSGATAACAGLGIQHSTLQLAHANGTPCCDPLPPAPPAADGAR